MPAQILNFADYHRTVIGFHGTDRTSAERLVAGEDFKNSDQDDEWFGKGIYFWEHAYKQAWWWAEKHKKYQEPAVVGAVIRLGNCFDLVDPGNIAILRRFYKAMIKKMVANNVQPPVNVRTHRKLDCALFNYVYNYCRLANGPLDTCRAVYVPTDNKKRICRGSWISEETHIQICVQKPENQKPSSILAVWHVRRDGRYGRDDL